MDEFLSSGVRLATPLAFAAYGGVLSERSGVFNIALEGALLAGAFGAAAGVSCCNSVMAGLFFGLLAGFCVGTILSLLTVTLGANQFVSGIAVNMLCVGLTSFLARAMGDQFSKSSDLTLIAVSPDFLHHVPILGPVLFSQNILVWFSIVLAVLMTYLLHRTRTGQGIRASGENQKVADFAGLPVNRIRFLSVLAGCTLASLGGCQLVLGQVHLFSEDMTAGRGFIALAAVIFGRNTFLGAGCACLLFGFCEAIELRMQFYATSIPYQLFTLFPYVMALIVLTISLNSNEVDDDRGKSFHRSSR